MCSFLVEVVVERDEVGLGRLKTKPSQALRESIANVEYPQVRAVTEDTGNVIGARADEGAPSLDQLLVEESEDRVKGDDEA